MDLELWANQSESFLISAGLDSEVIVWNLSPPFQQVFKETQSCQVTAICGAQDAIAQPILFIGTTVSYPQLSMLFHIVTFDIRMVLLQLKSYQHLLTKRHSLQAPIMDIKTQYVV